MKIDQKILTLLFARLKEQTPWITGEELRQLLKENGVAVTKETLSSEIEGLTRSGYLELRPVDEGNLGRGYITRLTIPGRNLWVHGRSLTAA
jgi:hypothetical protein